MVIVYHNGDNVIGIANANGSSISKLGEKSIAATLVEIAKEYPEEILIWCHQSLIERLNVSAMVNLFHHKKLLLSYNPSEVPFLDRNIGYIDQSLFIRINKIVTFPTWQMSSAVGGVYAEVLLALNNKIPLEKKFDYFLCSLGKLLMPKGLFCYSEPKLLKKKTEYAPAKTSSFTLFRFVRQHYKTQWVFLLLFNLIIYERKFSVMPFLVSLFYKNRNKANINLDTIMVQSTRKVVDQATVDVIIPTIGRKNYLFDVLKDFSEQTFLPNKIIIVEQNPKEGSTSELDYLANDKWPFEIQHIFTHQTGACNARNLALDQTQSEWVFLADDDNRFEATLLFDIFNKIEQYGNLVVTTFYPQKNELKIHTKVIQWPTFGAGNSFVHRDLLFNVKFNMSFEFGFGEDADFGMQLRNQGVDVLYLPKPQILHLKAPMGGFRTKPPLKWHNEKNQPKPSPTVMLYQMLHHTKEQIRGYKTILLFNYYRHQKIKNPIRYYLNFQKQWERSVFWANQLKQQNEV